MAQIYPLRSKNVAFFMTCFLAKACSSLNQTDLAVKPANALTYLSRHNNDIDLAILDNKPSA